MSQLDVPCSWGTVWPRHTSSPRPLDGGESSVSEGKGDPPGLDAARRTCLSDFRAGALCTTMPEIPLSSVTRKELPAAKPAKLAWLQVAGHAAAEGARKHMHSLATMGGTWGKTWREWRWFKWGPKGPVSLWPLHLPLPRALPLTLHKFQALAQPPPLCEERDFIYRRWCHESVVKGCDSVFV